jgi:hypothetical protein
MSAGDYLLFCSGNCQIWSRETDRQFTKARHWRAFLRVLVTFFLSARLAGWGGRIRTSEWWNQNPPPCFLPLTSWTFPDWLRELDLSYQAAPSSRYA